MCMLQSLDGSLMGCSEPHSGVVSRADQLCLFCRIFADVTHLLHLCSISLNQVPSKDARKLYLMYARFEEEHGLARRAMRVYDMLCRAVPPEQRYDVRVCLMLESVAAFLLVFWFNGLVASASFCISVFYAVVAVHLNGKAGWCFVSLPS